MTTAAPPSSLPEWRQFQKREATYQRGASPLGRRRRIPCARRRQRMRDNVVPLAAPQFSVDLPLVRSVVFIDVRALRRRRRRSGVPATSSTTTTKRQRSGTPSGGTGRERRSYIDPQQLMRRSEPCCRLRRQPLRRPLRLIPLIAPCEPSDRFGVVFERRSFRGGLATRERHPNRKGPFITRIASFLLIPKIGPSAAPLPIERGRSSVAANTKRETDKSSQDTFE